jgi:pimeloyl-ACP methyl ester carboxylesterase
MFTGRRVCLIRRPFRRLYFSLAVLGMVLVTQEINRSRNGFAAEYPFDSHFLDCGGFRYHYIDQQPQGGNTTSETILCVHGNPTWSFAWRKFVQDLSKSYRVIAVDHLGCGFSDKPQNYPYTLRQHIENLKQLITKLDLRNITLIAHDWGGAIGMGAAGELPDRFQRFVLCNTAAFRSTRMPFRIAVCRWPVLGPLGVRGFNLFSRAALTMAVSHRERMTPAVRAGYLAPYDCWANRVAVQRFVEDIPLSPKHPTYATLVQVEEGLKQFKNRPVLLAWGEQDWCFTPEFRKEFQSRLPQAEVLAIPDAGHYLFEDAPEIVLPRIRQFMQQHPLGERLDVSSQL